MMHIKKYGKNIFISNRRIEQCIKELRNSIHDFSEVIKLGFFISIILWIISSILYIIYI